MKFDVSNIDQRTIIKASVILLVIIGLYFLLRKAIKSIRSDNYQKDVETEIEAGQLSYPLNQYISLADQTHDAMAYLGTDFSVIKSVIGKMNNLSDLLQLIKAFGIRKYYGIWGEKTLSQWFQSELSASEIVGVNTILKNKNINFSF